MANLLITSGPTRQYLDPVRYLTNASSGKMGAALARQAINRGHMVEVISGPVEVDYPEQTVVTNVVTTEEMLKVAEARFPHCEVLIGAAAPCDYRPKRIAEEKISKTGGLLTLNLEETPDIVASLGAKKRTDQFVVGFALETDDHHFRAVVKAERKNCDLMVLNRPQAMHADTNDVEILLPSGEVIQKIQGTKDEVADGIVAVVERLVRERNDANTVMP